MDRAEYKIAPEEYEMKISWQTIDKLGVKMYDKVSAVMAELVANSYDADASEVQIIAPMGEYLADRISSKPPVFRDRGHQIKIIDNGSGMNPEDVQKLYLVVGRDKRSDKEKGADITPILKRKVMGRKGIGKLAPFGICKKIEVISAGGEPVKNGDIIIGYRTAHIILDKDKINDLGSSDEPYKPTTGKEDGSVSEKRGTTIILSDFDKRMVPRIEDFEKQLSHKFGMVRPDWKIVLINSNKNEENCTVGEFGIDYDAVKFSFVLEEDGSYKAYYNGLETTEILPGFMFEDVFYGVEGTAGLSKSSYKDELMVGYRIGSDAKLENRVF
ncbi:MAG: hypothetical protein GXY70_00005 [Euryarchaeota archaeon]|nr:hypothetical protein [Euryarchaeota archaeon]